MVLMEHRGLPGPPLSVSVGNWVRLWQHLAKGPEEQIWGVDQRLQMHLVRVEYDGPLVNQTSGIAPHDEINSVEVSNPAPHVEALDGQLSDYHEGKCHSDLCSGRVVCPVKI